MNSNPNRLLFVPMINRSLLLFHLLLPLTAVAEAVSPIPLPDTSPSGQGSPSVTPSKSVENAVVKVFSTLRAPDPGKPWRMLLTRSRNGI
jgi:hypothetical protein